MLAPRHNIVCSHTGLSRPQPAFRVRAPKPSSVPTCRVTAAGGPVFPGPAEEKEVSHTAFMHAFEAAKPAARIPGMQQFAAAVWERRRRIPSTTYNDPLDHIFTEFDEDGDGHLTAEEVAKALQSRGVQVDAPTVQTFIDAADDNHNGQVERQEFANFIFHMAQADLRSSASLGSTDGAQ